MFATDAESITVGLDLPVDDLTDDAVRAALTACATLQGRIDVLRARLLNAARERQLWRHDGARSLAAWLAGRTAISARDARRAADTSQIITENPDIAESVAAGHIAPAHVETMLALANDAAVAQAAADDPSPDDPSPDDPELVVDPAALLAAARGQTPETFSKATRGMRAALDPGGEAARFARLRSLRSLRTWTDASGMFHLHAQLDPAAGAFVERAINAVAEERWRQEHPDRAASLAPRESYEVRRADALTDMAQRILSGDGVNGVGGSCVDVIAVIDYRVLLDDLEEHGIATMADGTPIPAGLARLWACEHGVIPAVLNGKSVPLDYGSKRRFATPAQRQALMLRSATCEFAGCTVTAYASRIHHLTDWAESHTTNYSGLCIVCATHHSFVHLDGWRLRGGPGNTIETYRPDGTRHLPAREHRPGPAAHTRTAPPGGAPTTHARTAATPPTAHAPPGGAPTAHAPPAATPPTEPRSPRRGDRIRTRPRQRTRQRAVT